MAARHVRSSTARTSGSMAPGSVSESFLRKTRATEPAMRATGTCMMFQASWNCPRAATETAPISRLMPLFLTESTTALGPLSSGILR